MVQTHNTQRSRWILIARTSPQILGVWSVTECVCVCVCVYRTEQRSPVVQQYLQRLLAEQCIYRTQE